MTSFLLIDAFARGDTLALLALWSLILLRDHRGALAARVAMAMNLAIASHVLITMPIGILPPLPDRLLDLVSVTVPVLLWLFARSWFDDEQRIGWKSWLCVPATMALLGLVVILNQAENPLGQPLGALLRLTMFGFSVAGLWVAWRGRADDLVEGRRRLRSRLVWSVGLFVILTNAIEVAVNQDLLGAYWRSLVEMGITMLTFLFCAAMFGIRHEDLLGAPIRAGDAPVASPPIDEALADRLSRLLAEEKPWRDEGLTIAALAARLGEQEYRLRRLINRSLGHRNFAQFLNSYRLDEVRAALADPAQREVPILTIALDAGFGSLGPFNRTFRESEGMTPSEYRSKALADSGIG